MNREEALHTLGLGPDASPEDIKTAYKETAQILHPDRFAGNKKLAARATEQFKNLQEAYEVLTSGSSSRTSSGSGASRASYTRESQLNARLAGIDAARVQLVAQRDSFLDQRRTGIMLAVGGLVVAILLRRIRPLAAVAGAALVWGVVDLIAASRNLDAVNKQLALLRKERNAILDELAADEGSGEAGADYDYGYDYDESEEACADEEDGALEYDEYEEDGDYEDDYDDYEDEDDYDQDRVGEYDTEDEE